MGFSDFAPDSFPEFSEWSRRYSSPLDVDDFVENKVTPTAAILLATLMFPSSVEVRGCILLERSYDPSWCPGVRLGPEATMVTRVDDLLRGFAPSACAEPDVDPFVQDDELREAQVLEVRIDAVTSVAGILLDLRTALQLDVGCFALVVVRGVRSATWHADVVAGARTAWTVVDHRTTRPSGLVRLELDLWPDARCEVTGTGADLFVFDVPGIGATPPDYGSDGAEAVRAGLPGWRSAVTLLRWSPAS